MSTRITAESAECQMAVPRTAVQSQAHNQWLTMTLILKAAPIQEYGIIVNDVPKNTALKIQANVDNFWDGVKV